jgi:hypothetical protein
MIEISQTIPWATYTENFVPHFKKKEKPVEFEVGDKVSVVGTIGQFWRHNGQLMTDVKFDGEQNAACIPVSMLTLVERPKKFKVGRKYAHPVAMAFVYMYLGDDKWWNFNAKKAYDSPQIHKDNLDKFVPVEEDNA